jgi:hypothetical protein
MIKKDFEIETHEYIKELGSITQVIVSLQSRCNRILELYSLIKDTKNNDILHDSITILNELKTSILESKRNIKSNFKYSGALHEN